MKPIKKNHRGQSTIEYLIISVLLLVVLINGNPSPIERFFDALKTAYQRFSHSMSLP
jgi:Flp pilus assembly pilin Flp